VWKMIRMFAAILLCARKPGVPQDSFHVRMLERVRVCQASYVSVPLRASARSKAGTLPRGKTYGAPSSAEKDEEVDNSGCQACVRRIELKKQSISFRRGSRDWKT
jgi:hypothetical protein